MADKKSKECRKCGFYNPIGFWCKLKNKSPNGGDCCWFYIKKDGVMHWLITHWLKNWKFWIGLAVTIILGVAVIYYGGG